MIVRLWRKIYIVVSIIVYNNTMVSARVNEKVWRRFKAICNEKGVQIGRELTAVLDAYNKRNFKKAFS